MPRVQRRREDDKEQETEDEQEAPTTKQWLGDDWPMEDGAVQLTFSPTAWAKLLHFRDHRTRAVWHHRSDDPLFVQDVVAVNRKWSISVKFDDEAVSRFFSGGPAEGEQFARLGCIPILEIRRNPAAG